MLSCDLSQKFSRPSRDNLKVLPDSLTKPSLETSLRQSSLLSFQSQPKPTVINNRSMPFRPCMRIKIPTRLVVHWTLHFSFARGRLLAKGKMACSPLNFFLMFQYEAYSASTCCPKSNFIVAWDRNHGWTDTEYSVIPPTNSYSKGIQTRGLNSLMHTEYLWD